MTREEAAQVRADHLQGKDVLAVDLEVAVNVLARRRDKKLRLPDLPRPVKERVNAILAFRLGLAIGACRANP